MSFPRPLTRWRPRPGWTAGLVVVAALLGCAGTGPRSPSAATNRQACERYADHLNGLSACVGLVYDTDNLCEGTDLVPVDMVATYACLQAHTRCEGNRPILEADQCQLPLVALDGPVATAAEVPGGAR